MKRIIYLLCLILSFIVIIGCTPTNPNPSDNPKEPTKDPDEEEVVDLYEDIDEYEIKTYSSEEIKESYTTMIDYAEKQYNVSVEHNNLNKKNRKNMMRLNPDEILDYFYCLKDKINTEFANFCNEYAPIGIDTFVRIRLNDAIQELELSVKKGNSYYFFSNFYMDDTGHKYMEAKEDRHLTIELNHFEYQVENEKITYPIAVNHYFAMWNDETQSMGVGTDHNELNSVDDLENLDINQAHSSLKYPFYKSIDSGIITTLMNSSKATYLGERQFRKAIDKTIYNYNVVGDFYLDGLNYSMNRINGSLTDNIIQLESTELHYFTKTPSLFFMKNGGIEAFITITDYEYKLNDDGTYLLTRNIKQYSCLAMEDGSPVKTEDGCYFKLKKEIDLTKCKELEPWSTSDIVFNIPDDLIEKKGTTIEIDFMFGIKKSNGNFVEIVDVFYNE